MPQRPAPRPVLNATDAPMNTVRDLLARSDSPAHSVPPRASLLECARRMIERDAGALVVLEEDSLRGVVSWHDVLEVLAERPDRLANETAETLMTENVTMTGLDAELQDVESTMVDEGIHHVPVVDGTEVVGMVSQQTIVRDRMALMDAVNKQLSDYIREHYQKGLTTGHRLYESSL